MNINFFYFVGRFQGIICLLLVCLFFLSSCSPNMTAPAFEQIPIGSSITEIEAQVGSPYRMTTTQDGIQHYYYLERLETGPGIVSQNTYLLTVVDGQVVDKQRLNESSSLNFQIR